MLQTLHIRDLALIDAAEIRLDAGLNLLSGATGGGKSLLVTALRLLAGDRATANLVRHGADELRIDGEFLLAPGSALPEHRSAGGDRGSRAPGSRAVEGGVLLLTRIVDRRGRSKARIDGLPATLSELREVAAALLEFHAQGSTPERTRPEQQAIALDAFGGHEALRVDFAAALAAARDARERLRQAIEHGRAEAERTEFLRFQLAEIDELGLVPGECEALEAEQRVQAGFDRLRRALGAALAALQDDEPSAADLLARAEREVDTAAEIDPRLEEAAALLADARVMVAEGAHCVASRLADLEVEPGGLERIEARLAQLRRALRRFGPSEADLLQRRAELAAELAARTAEDGSPEALEQRSRSAVAELGIVAQRLQAARRAAAPGLLAQIERELADLGMADTQLALPLAEVLPDALELLVSATPSGPEPVDLMVRINPGEPFRSMRDCASGGETARLVLALETTLAERGALPFVVLDEIDAEVGGRLGLQVGRKLRAVAQRRQVLVVTHLPQVAAFADAHFRVDKRVRDGRSFTSVERLDAAGVERELAAMSAGEADCDQALGEARRLVVRARRPNRRAASAQRCGSEAGEALQTARSGSAP